MVFLVAILALIGLAVLVGFSAGWQSQRLSQSPPEDDLAAPYREGLRVAAGMQRAAQDLEQQIYAEATRHVNQSDIEP